MVDSALYEAVLQVTESLLPDYGASGHMRTRSGAILPGIAPSNAYPCKDGDIVIGANQDKVFARLAEVIGHPEWSEDPRWKTHNARGQRQVELDDLIARWTAQKTVAEVDRLLAEAGVPAGPIYRPDGMVNDPQFIARDAIYWEDNPQLGRIPMPNVFPRLSETPGAIRRPAPDRIGQHTDEILTGMLGMASEEIDRLRTAGIV